MPTTTHKIELAPGAFTNVSNGNLNCAVFVPSGAKVRTVVDGIEPDAGTDVFHLVFGPVAFQAENLDAESDVWMMPDDEAPITLTVIRGESLVAVIGQDRVM
jgi:hypothetical protein